MGNLLLNSLAVRQQPTSTQKIIEQNAHYLHPFLTIQQKGQEATNRHLKNY